MADIFFFGLCSFRNQIVIVCGFIRAGFAYRNSKRPFPSSKKLSLLKQGLAQTLCSEKQIIITRVPLQWQRATRKWSIFCS